MNNRHHFSEGKRTLVTLTAIIGVFITIVVILLSVRMRQTVESSLNLERKELLARLTETSVSVIDDNIAFGQSLVNLITDELENDIKYYSTVENFITDICHRNNYSGTMFFLVDSMGKYYASDGVEGKIVDTNYYIDSSSEKLSYISSLPHLAPNQYYLVIRNRLSKAINIGTVNGSVQLMYCGILYDLDRLSTSISQEFAGLNNTFIYDDTKGVMLYKDFGLGQILEGFNIYSKLSRCEILYDDDAKQIEEMCRSRKTVVSEIEIQGSSFYFCSTPLDRDNWSLAFIVKSNYLDEVSGNSFKEIVIYISLIAIILGFAVISLVVSFVRLSISEKNFVQIKVLNDELVKATNAKSDFLSNMSHDIRTPINGIMGMSTIAQRVEGNPEKTTECLKKIDGASQHLLSLINDILDMSRIERGKTEIAVNPINILTVIDNCTSIIKGQMTGRDLNLKTDIVCEHPNVMGDELHLRQIFINILSNAVKFTKDGGTIWFRCNENFSPDGNTSFVFEIEDTGIGMKPDFVGKVFDVFTQDEGGARSNYKGSGLGMAISKSLTELMGGTISVESQLGKGSKFTVIIPFVINTENVAEEEVYVQDTGLDGIRLLLADDNELNMDIAEELLSSAGAMVTTVVDGKQALEAFINNPPGTFDAILMDVMMPVMNGIDATKAIRSYDREDASTIPILAMTANAFDSDIKATAAAGMNAHLIKPIDISEVINTIIRFTEKH